MIRISTLTVSAFEASGVSLDDLLKYLPEASRNRLLLISNTGNRNRSLLGELLARNLLCRQTGLKNSSLIFQFAEKGKPSLAGFPDIHFNISHSGDRVACAVAGSDVGIDVERFRRVNFRVAERYFSSSELDDLLALTGIMREEYFFTLWTIKESFLKAIGSGLTRNLNSFTVIRNQSGFSITGDVHATAFALTTYRLDKDYFMAVCCRETGFPQSVDSSSMQELTDILDPFE